MYHVIIVGTGPAGMFAALALTQLAPHLKVLMLEKGKLRSLQDAAAIRAAYEAGEQVNVTEGWGGAGAYSDGKYNLDESGRVGGRLVTGGFMPRVRYNELLHLASKLYVEYGADGNRMFGVREPQDEARVREIRRMASGHNMVLHEFPIMHLGTSNAHLIVENFRSELERRGVEIITECRVESFVREPNGWRVITSKGDYTTTRVIACPGRSGASWFREAAQEIGIELANNGVDVGVRVETTMDIMEELTRLFYESKFYFTGGNDDSLRTFCMCPYGLVAVEEYRDTEIFCANGHTDPAHKTPNCNFSVLQTQVFTRPFNDPLAYGRAIAALHTMLSGGGILVQRLGDLRKHRRSTEHRLKKGMVQLTCTDPRVIPGDIGLAMPGRFIHGIIHFLDALAVVAPGISSDHTLLYSPEIKFNAVRANANPSRGFEALSALDEPLTGFHVAGDGTGYTRGLNGASVHGLEVGGFVATEMGGRPLLTA